MGFFILQIDKISSLQCAYMWIKLYHSIKYTYFTSVQLAGRQIAQLYSYR